MVNFTGKAPRGRGSGTSRRPDWRARPTAERLTKTARQVARCRAESRARPNRNSTPTQRWSRARI